MGADFHIRGDTKLDSSGFSKGIDKLGSVAKKGAATMQSPFQGATGALGQVAAKASSAASEIGKLGKDAGEADPYLAKLQSTLQETTSELDKLTQAYRQSVVEKGRFATETQELAAKIKEAERKQSELRSEIEKTSSFQQAADKAAEYATALASVESEFRDVEKQTSAANSYIQSLRNTLEQTSETVDKLSYAYQKSVAETGKYSEKSQYLSAKLSDAKRRQSELQDEVEKASYSFKQATSSTEKYGSQSDRTKVYINKLKNELKETEQKVQTLSEQYQSSVIQTGRYSKETKTLAEKLSDAKQRQSELRDELEKSSLSAKKYGFNLEKLGSALSSSLKLAAASAIGSVLALGKIGLDYNAQMESYTTDFEVMLGDVGAAAEKVESLKQMAAKTPFELTDLANSTKILLAFNVANEDTNTVLQQLGDISLGNVEKMDSLTRAYGKMNASQKVTLEDINMMIDAGYNPLLNIQEKTGESMSDLYARISDGQVAFSEVQEAIAAATSEGGQFYQGMEKASQTTQGLTSTLRDVVNSKAGEFFSELSQKVKAALPEIIEFIESINVEEAKNRLKELYDQFVELSPIIAAITGAVIGFKTAMTISAIIDKATKAITAFKLANDAATISQAALNFVMNLNPFVLIATLIAGAVAALVVLWNTNEDFRNAVIAIWEAIKQAFSVAWEWIVGVWNQFQPYFQMAWDFLVSVFSQVVQTVSEPFAAAWQLIVTVWNLALPYFQAFWDFLVGIFTPIAEILGNFFSAAWEWIVGVWNAAQPYFQAIWSGIQTVFSVVSEVLGLYFRTAWNVIQLIWNAVTGYFQNIFNTISNIFSFIEALFRGDFQAAWDSIVEIFTGWGEYFQGLFDKIGEIFSDIWDTFKKIGSDAIEALKDGINAAWDGLVSWFNGLWDGLFGNRTASVTVNKTVNETVTRSGRSVNGSHRSGLDYVPFDGYIAELHKGEMVLTSQQAGLWRNGIAQRMLSAASSVMLANQARSPVLATAGAPALSRQTAVTVQTQHTTVIEMDGRTVAKVITPFVDQFLF